MVQESPTLPSHWPEVEPSSSVREPQFCEHSGSPSQLPSAPHVSAEGPEERKKPAGIFVKKEQFDVDLAADSDEEISGDLDAVSKSADIPFITKKGRQLTDRSAVIRRALSFLRGLFR